jgi:hypothetical protein
VQNLTLFGYQVEFDADSTHAWYTKADEWGCDCGHCRNFLKLAGSGALPSTVLEPLKALGIPPEKATYVGELYTDDAGIHYQFSYRLAGAILTVPNHVDPGSPGRCCHEPYPYGAPSFPTPHFDLEFYAVLPWAAD